MQKATVVVACLLLFMTFEDVRSNRAHVAEDVEFTEIEAVDTQNEDQMSVLQKNVVVDHKEVADDKKAEEGKDKENEEDDEAEEDNEEEEGQELEEGRNSDSSKPSAAWGGWGSSSAHRRRTRRRRFAGRRRRNPPTTRRRRESFIPFVNIPTDKETIVPDASPMVVMRKQNSQFCPTTAHIGSENECEAAVAQLMDDGDEMFKHSEVDESAPQNTGFPTSPMGCFWAFGGQGGGKLKFTPYVSWRPNRGWNGKVPICKFPALIQKTYEGSSSCTNGYEEVTKEDCAAMAGYGYSYEGETASDLSRVSGCFETYETTPLASTKKLYFNNRFNNAKEPITVNTAPKGGNKICKLLNYILTTTTTTLPSE